MDKEEHMVSVTMGDQVLLMTPKDLSALKEALGLKDDPKGEGAQKISSTIMLPDEEPVVPHPKGCWTISSPAGLVSNTVIRAPDGRKIDGISKVTIEIDAKDGTVNATLHVSKVELEMGFFDSEVAAMLLKEESKPLMMTKESTYGVGGGTKMNASLDGGLLEPLGEFAKILASKQNISEIIDKGMVDALSKEDAQKKPGEFLPLTYGQGQNGDHGLSPMALAVLKANVVKDAIKLMKEDKVWPLTVLSLDENGNSNHKVKGK